MQQRSRSAKTFRLGKINVDLSKLPPLREYKLVVTVGPTSFFGPVDKRIIPGPGVVRGETYFENAWNFWLYPAGNTVAETQSTKEPEARLSHHANDCPPSRSPGTSDNEFLGRS